MNARRGTRPAVLSAACAALLAGVAACGGGGGSKERDALEAQLTKGPFKGYEQVFRGGDGKALSPGDAKKRLDCYADVLLEYGDKDDLAAYSASGEDYVKIGISESKEFNAKADACLGDENVSQYAPPYPVAGLG
jgi:hypothetical protein